MSASVPAVDAWLARMFATVAELKPATIAMIPMDNRVIAIRSSISWKPSWPRIRTVSFRTRLIPDQLSDVSVAVPPAVHLAGARLCRGLRLDAADVDDEVPGAKRLAGRR